MDTTELLNEVIPDMTEAQLDELHELLLNTQEQCQMMEQFIKNQIVVKDEMINKLHKELESYKKDSSERFENQLLKEVIKVRKTLKRVMASEGWESMSEADLRREYQDIYDDLTDLLILQNVDEFSTEPGSPFSAAIHQVKIEETNDAAVDKTIKKSLSEGYKKGDKVLIAERVIAYQYKEQ